MHFLVLSFSVSPLPCTKCCCQPDSSSRQSLDHLKSEAFTLIEASLSSNTRQTYGAAVRSLKQFRSEVNFPQIWPATVDHILCYIANMSRRTYSSSTVALHLSALARHHKVNCWLDPTDQSLVRKYM